MKYEFIKNHESLFPIEKMCSVLKVSYSIYYKWEARPLSNRERRKRELKKQIISIYFAAKQRCGSPRITVELESSGFKTFRITVAKYMKELGLRSKLSRKFRVTTDSKHNYLVAENILNRNFLVGSPSHAWVFDITYLQTKDGFLYLTAIIDLFDRKVIGWSLCTGMSATETSLAAWKISVKNRKVGSKLIFHSDRGVQYASKKFTNTLAFYGVKGV
ncbi:IS3 family transposase [Chryseobacterium sp. NKUCC03_KSP]|uniref:IS3 family transposase n=1 Tax=Chryseobacterium sp. NKUCC03_KSP TaxID=2842125 RepID=UPI0035A92621